MLSQAAASAAAAPAASASASSALSADTLTLTGAQALVRLLIAEQVPAVFGIVGGKLAPVLHASSATAA